MDEILNTTFVSISMARLMELERFEDKLLALEAFGVDNWDGYEEAMASLNGEQS